MNAPELFKAGRLREAISAAAEAVKGHPSDAVLRAFYAELLCFVGELDRADKQLDALTQLDPGFVPVMATWRQLLRGDKARSDFFRNGRVPEFFTVPDQENTFGSPSVKSSEFRFSHTKDPLTCYGAEPI